MARLWEAWQDHAGSRSLVFCCSVRHAAFVHEVAGRAGRPVRRRHRRDARWTRDEPRSSSLGQGDLDAVCAVDLFNEGVDLPGVDRVVMLRPTESPVLFLQQLGRGLRKAEGKPHLTVIDFVGNHRVFLGPGAAAPARSARRPSPSGVPRRNGEAGASAGVLGGHRAGGGRSPSEAAAQRRERGHPRLQGAADAAGLPPDRGGDVPAGIPSVPPRGLVRAS